MLKNNTKSPIALPSGLVLTPGNNPDATEERLWAGDNEPFVNSLVNSRRISITSASGADSAAPEYPDEGDEQELLPLVGPDTKD